MTNETQEKIIKEIVTQILEKMTFTDFDVKIESQTSPDGHIQVANIETPDSNLLIGQYGVTLRALQHIARLLVRRKTEEKLKFLVDVNHYLSQKVGSLSEIARSAAKQAITEGRPVILRPMSAYERRIIHLELLGADNVKTESIGEGEERKVIVKPVGEMEKLENKSDS